MNRLPYDNPCDLLPISIEITPARQVFHMGERITLICTFINPNPSWKLMLGTGETHRSWLTVTLIDDQGRTVPEVPDTRPLPFDWMISPGTRVEERRERKIVLPLGGWLSVLRPGRYCAKLDYRLAYAAEGTLACDVLLGILGPAHGRMRTWGDTIFIPDNGLFPFVTGSCQVDFEIMPPEG